MEYHPAFFVPPLYYPKIPSYIKNRLKSCYKNKKGSLKLPFFVYFYAILGLFLRPSVLHIPRQIGQHIQCGDTGDHDREPQRKIGGQDIEN